MTVFLFRSSPACSTGRPPAHPARLAALAADVAARPALWQPRLDPRVTVRTYASLHRDPDLELWAIAWLPDTTWAGMTTIARAASYTSSRALLDEHVLRLGGADRRVRHVAGDDVRLRARPHPPGHLLRRAVPSPSTSIPPRSGGSASTRSTRTTCSTADGLLRRRTPRRLNARLLAAG